MSRARSRSRRTRTSATARLDDEDDEPKTKMWLLTGANAALSSCLFYLVNRVQPEPYMDEIFHVAQARRYCLGKFSEWDDKITTLPGLYVISVGVLSPASEMLQRLQCDTWHLRLVSLAMWVLTLPILHTIIIQIHGGKHQFYDVNKMLLSALNLSIFPLFYFFGFLYYTDVGSTFLVLLMYSLHLDRRDWLAALIGLLSVCFRQTNIIWVMLMAMQALAPRLVPAIHAKLHEHHRVVKFSLSTNGQIQEFFEGCLALVRDPVCLFNSVLRPSLVDVGGYILVALLFCGFVLSNGGIAVGDRTAHQITFHPMQLAYFCLFSLAFSWSFCISKAAPLMAALSNRRRWTNLWKLMAALVVTVVLVNGYTMAHPYLLADNRHYTFYLWRRLIVRNEWTKFALVPAYVFGAYCIMYSLRRNSIVFRLFFPLCVALNLAPQLLLELRYFIIPYLMYRLQVRPQTWWKLLGETATYLGINVITFYLFLYRPFSWPSQPDSLQRFMW